ncbi:MAG: phage terminase large subunit [Rhizorhabdus sp.]|uniref:phage terminase large subunit n=1 Tax=Rhizorhabdus sp. TaxID=1968843 RepID=UPI001B408965|nr:phage terminase large subunit [Rhizorhabdus sp.]MBP8231750.1 phage terminase large subunit [Rhizorhabdus sp.]
MTKDEIAREIRRRLRARTSLHTYALSIDIPTVAAQAMLPDEELLGPASGLMAQHHAAILSVLERTANRNMGRCMIFAPPGAAKSLYTSVLLPTWEMGRRPGSRIMLVSYAGSLAERQARRAMQVVEQENYRLLWDESPTLVRDAAKEWTLSNKSEMLSMGLLGGLTGNRASGAIIDDPVAGREEADSEDIRQKTRDAYQDDLLSRLLPGAWIAFIMTRWHEDDLAGAILPEDYDGRSGMVRCRDGLDWEILNIQAKCERADDPLGRQLGEYLWTEFYPPQHWRLYENAQGPEAARAWASLYQQRPSPQGSGRFNREMFNLYSPKELPQHLAYVGASDFAVTEGRNDFTEHGLFGVDSSGNLWARDWWSKQSNTGEGIDAMLNMVQRWKTPMWFNEGGVIDKATRPAINQQMRERRIYTDLRSLPSMLDKVAKCSAFQARAAAGCVYFPREAPWTERVIQQLMSLPAGRHDDAADVCGLIGRAVDQFPLARVPSITRKEGIKPFTKEWLEYQAENERPAVRYR